MDRDILRKYQDQRVPRYTSYPTAPHFGPAVDEARYRGWLAATDPEIAASLYLHVPFCRVLCTYCGCHTKIVNHDEPIVRYVGLLSRELELLAEALPGRRRLRHLHWGGGTPTAIPAPDFERAMALVRRLFDFEADAELAIEIDPRTLTADMAALLGGLGINRASFGVQTFDRKVQLAINRVQSFEVTAGAVTSLRRAGVARVNFDLLYGLPHQTVESCRDTVRTVLPLAPDRLAVFGYAHVPEVKPHQRLIDETALPGPAERLAQAEAIAEELDRAGYVRVGLDHFALPADPMVRALRAGTLRRNFQGYTTDAADMLFGVGTSSIGALPQGYAQNETQFLAYKNAVAEGRLPVTRGIELDADDRFRRELIERVMCFLAVDLGAVAARHGVPREALGPLLDALEPLRRDGIVRRDGERIEVPEEYRALVRSVAAAFDAYLNPAAGRHSLAV